MENNVASIKSIPLYFKIQKRIFEIIEKGKPGDHASIAFDIFIMSLILLNVAAIILESFNAVDHELHVFFRIFEIVSIVIFTIEYVLRLWTSKLKTEASNGFVGLLKYIKSPMAVIDLLAILPFYLPFLIPIDLRFLRILRLTRIFRVFKIQRYSKSLSVIAKVLKNKKEQLLVTIFITLLLIVFASTVMYYIENEVQPKAFPNILATFWWAVATLTTIGYGDVYPITDLGRLLSAVIAILGIGLVALPTGLISSGFIEELSKNKKKVKEERIKYCPYCGKKIVKDD
ncbi:MAG: ion transporter [Spirochaetales bacterium]|nr:ion transporter [Spirochaetales bacterium]